LIGPLLRPSSVTNKVGIYCFTPEPGASVAPATNPNPSLMYIETGESTGEAESHVCPAGTTWCIPGGIEDAALNEGSTLMSSLIIEFVPVEEGVTPTT
jgi:hypothetical protein